MAGVMFFPGCSFTGQGILNNVRRPSRYCWIRALIRTLWQTVQVTRDDHRSPIPHLTLLLSLGSHMPCAHFYSGKTAYSNPRSVSGACCWQPLQITETELASLSL